MEFPIKGELDGVRVVIVSAEEHQRLCGAAIDDGDRIAVDAAIARVVDRLRVFGGPRSPITFDRPLALFLADAALDHTIAQARTACIARFGGERTPSTSAISRYWKRLRTNA